MSGYTFSQISPSQNNQPILFSLHQSYLTHQIKLASKQHHCTNCPSYFFFLVKLKHAHGFPWLWMLPHEHRDADDRSGVGTARAQSSDVATLLSAQLSLVLCLSPGITYPWAVVFQLVDTLLMELEHGTGSHASQCCVVGSGHGGTSHFYKDVSFNHSNNIQTHAVIRFSATCNKNALKGAEYQINT